MTGLRDAPALLAVSTAAGPRFGSRRPEWQTVVCRRVLVEHVGRWLAAVGSAYPCQHRGVSQAHRSPRGPGRFLLATIDGGGTVPPALGLASTLVRRGHQVCVLSDPIVASAAESAGCSFTPWREAPHFSSREQQTTVIAAFESRNPFRAISAVRTFWPPGTSRRYARDVISAAREGGADAVLAESAVPGILIGALSTRLPTAALVPNVYMRPTTGFPLLGTGWSPGRTLLGQVRDRLAPKGARWLLDRTLPGLNAVLADYGEPLVARSPAPETVSGPITDLTENNEPSLRLVAGGVVSGRKAGPMRTSTGAHPAGFEGAREPGSSGISTPRAHPQQDASEAIALDVTSMVGEQDPRPQEPSVPVSEKLIQRVCLVVVGIITTIATKRLLTLGWTAVTGKKPPRLGDPKVSWGDAVSWAVASGIGIGITQLLARRLVIKYLTRKRG
jgi:hypothetical protein